MAQKFKFKLEALLKLREFRELKAKIDLGKTNSAIALKKEKIVSLNKDIDVAYFTQQHYGEKGATIGELAFYPFYVDGLKAHVKQLENEIIQLEQKAREQIALVAKLRAEVKLVNKLKEKDRDHFNRELNKKIYMDLEDDFIITRLGQEGDGR